MAKDQTSFSFVAIDPAGHRVKGSLSAGSDALAFERLRRDGLSPIAIRRQRRRASASQGGGALSERELAEFLSDLAVLLDAGSDMRAALSILGGRASRPNARALSRALMEDVAGGTALDQAFNRALGKDQHFVGAFIAAGEAAGDIASGFQRAAGMMQSRLKLKDQMVSVLSYPAFVFVSTVVAIGVILLFVVPSLAPLVEDAASTPPVSLQVLISISSFLRSNLLSIAATIAALIVVMTMAAVLGLLTRPIETLALDGPTRRTSGALVFGGFAITLGDMLAAGTPMSDALRLAIRSVRSGVARERLETAAQAVRDGQMLSIAFGALKGFPPAVARLTAVGEASGALGAMLSRAGKLEEDAAIRRIEALGRIAGPALIVILGAIVGVLMAGLLSGVSQLGGTALQS